MRRFIGLFLFFTMGGSLLAGLGENGDAIENAYGTLVARHLQDDGTVAVFYHKDRYLYYVIFDRGISVSERYSRYDRKDLSPKEVAKFLKMNAGRAMKWDPRSEERGQKSEKQGAWSKESGKTDKLKTDNENEAGRSTGSGSARSEEQAFERSDHKAEATLVRVEGVLALTVRVMGGK